MVKGTSHDKNPHKITIGTFEPSNWTNLGGHDESGRCKKIRSSPFDPPQKTGGWWGWCVLAVFFFFAKVPVPSTSWEVGNLEVEKREDEGRMCWAYLVPSGQLVEATRIVSLIHWVEEDRQFRESRSWKTPTFAYFWARELICFQKGESFPFYFRTDSLPSKLAKSFLGDPHLTQQKPLGGLPFFDFVDLLGSAGARQGHLCCGERRILTCSSWKLLFHLRWKGGHHEGTCNLDFTDAYVIHI